MPDLSPLTPAAAAAALRDQGARGFLDLDPVTQNDELLAAELTRTGARVFRSGTALVGYRPNERQPRQAYLACTTADPGPVGDLMGFLATYQRVTSFVATVPADGAAESAFAGCGFGAVGTLREHTYADGRHRDVRVWFGRVEDPCRS